jgi:SAM-dependent methyltransferase
MPQDRCPACGSPRLEVFHRDDDIPAHSCLLLASREEALSYPRGSIRLAVCEACGFITNTAFDPSLNAYGSTYEETQGYSPRFMAFARSLAERWIEQYGLRHKQVLEIGCGKGEFLAIICELGDNEGVGIDPSVKPERLSPETLRRVRVLPEIFGPQHHDIPADAIICRHTLEHIHPVAEFVGQVRKAIGDRRDTVVLFEVPDTKRVLEQVAFWDVYYEHCSYFTAGSLARLFRRSGFDVVDLSLAYDDQYILLAARPADGPTDARLPLEDDLEATIALSRGFERRYAADIPAWRDRLRGYGAAGKEVAIWGGGSKGVAFLTTLGDVAGIDYAVDINPHKAGMYLAGTGKRIVAPEYLVEHRPDVVVVMNSIYTDEIRARMAAMGVQAEMIALS